MHTTETHHDQSVCILWHSPVVGWYPQGTNPSFSLFQGSVPGKTNQHWSDSSYWSLHLCSPLLFQCPISISTVSALPNLSSRTGKKLETAGKCVWIPLRSSAHPHHPACTNTHCSAVVEDTYPSYIQTILQKKSIKQIIIKKMFTVLTFR